MAAGSNSYKWILYGDDDTVFMVDNVLALLNSLDHEHPISSQTACGGHGKLCLAAYHALIVTHLMHLFLMGKMSLSRPGLRQGDSAFLLCMRTFATRADGLHAVDKHIMHLQGTG